VEKNNSKKFAHKTLTIVLVLFLKLLSIGLSEGIIEGFDTLPSI